MLPGLAAALAAAVIAQTVESWPTVGPGERFAAVLGILVGSSIAYRMALRSRVVFDAARGEVGWQHFGWPGRAQDSCPLDRVTGVRLLEDSSGLQRLALSTTEGVVPLTRHFAAFQPHARNVAAIEEWLALQGRAVPRPDTTPAE